MYWRSISCFIFISVAAISATNYTDSDSTAGSDPEVTVYHLRTEKSESSTMDPVQEITDITTVDLGALLDAGVGATVTLVAGDTRLVAHRAVLAARSPVFAAMLRHYVLESSGGGVAVPDVEGAVLRLLVAYLYTLRAPQLPGMAPQLLAAADRYGVSALKADCERQVAAQLSVETAAAAAVLAVKHSASSLREAAVTFIKAHFVQVLATPGWADAVVNQPKEVVQVSRLLSDELPETSTPAAASAAGGTRSPATGGEPHAAHRDRRPPPATAGPSTARPHSTPKTDGSTASRPLVPVTTDGRASASTQPPSEHSDHSWTPVTTTWNATTRPTLPTDGADVSSTQAPVSENSGALHSSQPLSDHSSSSRTPATAAPPTARQTTPQPDDAAVSLLRNLSMEEKGRRLIEAAKQGAVEELRALLAAGADVEAKDGDADWYRRPALHWAAYWGHVEAVRSLLEGGAQVDARDRWQNTALHRAAERGHTPVLRLLVASSADPNATDKAGWTPLHLAASQGHAEAATALLEAGADKGARTSRGDTPLAVARQYHKQQLIDILK